MAKKKVDDMYAISVFMEVYADMGFKRACGKSGVRPWKKALSSDTKYYVYVLVCDDMIIYVGKGKGKRMFSHMKEAGGLLMDKITSPRKYFGLRELIYQGKGVTEYSLVRNLNEDSALELESKLIHSLPAESLLNTQRGQAALSENQIAIKQMQDVIRNAPPISESTDLKARATVIESAKKLIEDIKISDALGIDHSDWWDLGRVNLHMRAKAEFSQPQSG